MKKKKRNKVDMSVSAADLNTVHMNSRGLQLAAGHRRRVGKMDNSPDIVHGTPRKSGPETKPPNGRYVCHGN